MCWCVVFGVCLSVFHFVLSFIFGPGLCVASDVFHFVSEFGRVDLSPPLTLTLPFVPISHWSLLVSSLLLGSGWGGMGDFGSYVFVD